MTSNAAQAIFWADLAKWGPDKPPSPCDLPFALKHCRVIARSHYENFTVVSWFLPRTLQQDFYNFYAYCRATRMISPMKSRSTVACRYSNWWHQQLCLCYSGRPAHPVMLALQQTIQAPSNPHRITLEDLLSAFRQDQSTLRYRETMPSCSTTAAGLQIQSVE